jgi:UDP-glucose 4-epimerase
MALNYLITGGCGFIGRTLVERLVGRGDRVRVLDNLSVGTRNALPAAPAPVEIAVERLGKDWSPLELVVADIRDARATLAAAVGAEVIVHLAANTGVALSIDAPREDCEHNVFGVLNILEAARAHGVRRFVFASSGATLGDQPPPWHEDMAARPLSPYGASKLAGEAYCMAYSGSFGVESVALRFANVYGPRSDHKTSVVAKYLRRALAGEALEIYGDGSQTRDFIYIDDLVDAIEKATALPGLAGQVFQIGTAHGTSIVDLARMVAQEVAAQTGRDVPVLHASSLVGEVHRSVVDISKARRLLGYEPKVGLQVGLKRTLEYFLESMRPTRQEGSSEPKRYGAQRGLV